MKILKDLLKLTPFQWNFLCLILGLLTASALIYVIELF